MMSINDAFDDKYRDKFQNARTVGIDIGSRGAKGIMLYDGNIYSVLQSSGVSSVETGQKLLDELLLQSGVEKNSIEYIVGTGYGRIAMEFEKINFIELTEITCHAIGAHYLNADTVTILDIGGQDSKAIRINPVDGTVVEFIMNDKCAAGTGRFLEKVATLLDLNLNELGEYAVRSKNPIDISSQCVVFAESEVVSLKAHDVSKEDIAAGIHLAAARRVQYLLKKVGLDPAVLFTGGVSKNVGMRKAVEAALNVELAETKYDTIFAGAIGAAIHAFALSQENKKI